MIPLPILLIHGFNGQPANWTDPEDRFPDFLAEHGFDPALIRLFSYGFIQQDGKPIYNATGDIRAIAHRLDESNSDDPETRLAAVDQLSRDSVARGGPSKITIIAHSSGGLVARYYLSCRNPDEFQTTYRGNVGRVIMLGTPHLGVDVEAAFDPLPTPIVFGLLSHMHPAFPHADLDDIQEMRNSMRETRQALRHDFFGNAVRDNVPAYKQFHPGSEFLRELNRPGVMPQEISYFNVAGDVRVCAAVKLGQSEFLREKGLGDLLVSKESACTIPNASSICDTVVARNEIDITVGGAALIQAHVNGAIGEPLPLHRNLRSHPGVRRAILKILARSRAD